MDIARRVAVVSLACGLGVLLGCTSRPAAPPSVQAANISLLDQERIERAVGQSIKYDYPIDFIQVAGNERFTPTKGPDGAEGRVTRVESMFRGEGAIELDQTIHLYPYTESSSVIVLTVEGGNWLDAKYYDYVKRLIEEARADAPASARAPH